MQTTNIEESLKTANNYFANRDLNNAIQEYNKILAIDSSNINAYFGLANAYNEKGEMTLAIENYEKAINLNPNHAVLYRNLGVAYAKKEDHDMAVKSFLEAIKLMPDDVTSLDYMAVSYQRLQKYDLAVEGYKKALELNPENIDVRIHLGTCYHDMEQYDNAIATFEEVLKLSPNNVDAYNNMGTSYQSKEAMDQAIKCYNKVMEINPNYFQVYVNLGVCHFQVKEFDKAISFYKKGIELDPTCAEAHNNLGSVYRITENFEKGWELYEYRFVLNNAYKSRVKVPSLSKPRWKGQDIKGKTIYLYPEQGFGDTLMFSRYIPLIKDMGARILFKPPKALADLFKLNNFGAEIINFDTPDKKIQFDEHSPLASLPLVFKTDLSNIPYAEGYLKADPLKVNAYKEKYFNNNKFKIGIFWQGNPKGLKSRATKLEYFLRFAEIENVILYSLQKGFGIEQLKEVSEGINVVDLGSTFNDYSDTSAAIENLDLVISIDSGIIHLAGAMSKPVWMMLNWDNEWRWLINREDTPWYKSVRIFQQKEQDNWEELFNRVKPELELGLNSGILSC